MSGRSIFPPNRNGNRKWVARIVLLAALLCATRSWALHNLISLDAEVDEAQSQITFSWQRADTNPAAMSISRRPVAAGLNGPWQLMATVPREVTSWVNGSLPIGTEYEYWFHVPIGPGQPHATGAFASGGIRVPLQDQRGRVLLVVDNTLATGLARDLQRFTMDLVGDGWVVDTLNFGRHGAATPEALRAEIQTRHASNPLSSIILFGRLPVILSGLINPDEHGNYQQATDLFYADVDGNWQDVLSTSIPNEPNHYAGDGHYDQNFLPGPNHRIEIPIGRIDLSEMTAWQETESDLMRRYLEKNHNFRLRHHEVPRKAYFTMMAFDESPLEAAAAVAMLGPENADEAYDNETEQSRPFLWGFAGRDWNGQNYPNYRFKSHFTVNFASGKQAWQWDNNQMRAMLAMPWYGLTCTWGVRPNWLFHPAGMGKTLGFCNLLTANNNNIANRTAARPYEPVYEYFEDHVVPLDGMVHINLMGDPTLRIHPVAPPRNFAAVADAGGVTLTWQPADDDAITGYHVYRSTHRSGPYTRLTSVPVQAIGFRDTSAAVGERFYMVRTIKLEDSRSGTYLNASQGVFTRRDGSAVNRPPRSIVRMLATRQGQTVQFTPGISDPDGDQVTLFAAGPASHGEVRVSQGTVSYTAKAGFVGSDQFEFIAWDGLAESVSTVHVTVTAQDPVISDAYEVWRSGIAWAGKDSTRQGDPNGNGLSNLMEYHLARNPLAANSPLFSRMEKVVTPSGEFVVLEYRRRKNHPPLVMQSSVNGMSHWTTLVPDGESSVVEVLAADPLGNGTAEDLRLSIRLSPFVSRWFCRFEAF